MIEEVYHGSEDEIINNFEKNGFQKSIRADFNDLIQGRQRNIGSLGVGTYAFLESEKLAARFSKKQCRNPAVISFKIKYDADNDSLNLLDNLRDMYTYGEYWENEKVKSGIKKFKSMYKDGRFLKSFQGALIEYYIHEMVRTKKMDPVKVVKMGTYTPEDNNAVLFSSPNNGVEICIRDIDIVDNTTITRVWYVQMEVYRYGKI